MARPSTISDEEIIDAAREIFLEHGLSATTAQVAARAGVSEALVFHRFKRKEELFQRAMDRSADPPWLVKLDQRVGKGDVREQITEVAQEGLDFFRLIVPLAMLGWSHDPEGGGAPHHHVHRAKPGEDHPAIRGQKILARYFEAEMRLGRIARHDAEVVARTFVGALWNYVSMELMFEAKTRMPLPEPMYLRGYVELLFGGLGTAKQSPKEKKR